MSENREILLQIEDDKIVELLEKQIRYEYPHLQGTKGAIWNFKIKNPEAPEEEQILMLTIFKEP